MKKKDYNIVFTPSTVVDSLRPYINQILEAIADVFDKPGATGALVTDESSIWCYLDSVPTGETRPHPFDKGKLCTVVTSDTPENRELVKKLATRLGVPVSMDDRLYEVAIRLRDG